MLQYSYYSVICEDVLYRFYLEAAFFERAAPSRAIIVKKSLITRSPVIAVPFFESAIKDRP